MTSLRRLLLDHRALALGLAIVALLVTLLVPAGFMVGVRDGHAVLELCSGTVPHPAAMTGTMHGERHGKADHAKTESPCPYAALAQGIVAPVDPVLLALALAFVLSLAFRAVPPPASRTASYLRPPLRGPPIPS